MAHPLTMAWVADMAAPNALGAALGLRLTANRLARRRFRWASGSYRRDRGPTAFSGVRPCSSARRPRRCCRCRPTTPPTPVRRPEDRPASAFQESRKASMVICGIHLHKRQSGDQQLDGLPRFKSETSSDLSCSRPPWRSSSSCYSHSWLTDPCGCNAVDATAPITASYRTGRCGEPKIFEPDVGRETDAGSDDPTLDHLIGSGPIIACHTARRGPDSGLRRRLYAAAERG
jgi:hypothetical protein